MTEPKTIGLLSPGNMGAGVGGALIKTGHTVLSLYADRSDITKMRAINAGLIEAGSLENLVERADLILSIAPPEHADQIIRSLAAVMTKTKARPLVVDANAVSPDSTRALAAIMDDVDCPFLDGSIIGMPPSKGGNTSLLLSGPGGDQLGYLDGHGFNTRFVGDGIGKASAIKMLFGATTKGLNALYTSVLMSAQSLGVLEELTDEFNARQPATVQKMASQPFLPADSGRWIYEMDQIAEKI